MVQNLKYLIVALALTLGSAALADCQIDHVHLDGPWGRAQFTVDIVDTPKTRAQGLMYRRHMPRGHGMLFVFQNAAPRQFWMKNTYIPLDILFFDSKGRLLNIIHSARPHDLTSLPSEGPAQYALEINGGLSKRFGITQKTTILKNPAVDANCFTN